MTFSARFIANIIQFATQQGADTDQLLAIGNWTWEILSDEQLRFEAPLYNALLETAVEQTGDSCFGLHLGEYLSLSAAGLIGQITQTCNTVHEALEYMVAFANLGCQALPVQLKERKKDWLISYTPSAEWKEQSPVAVRHTLEAVMAFSLREFHTLTLQKTYPRAVYFDYERPARFGEYERIFQCPVHFAKAENAMVLDKEQVAAKVVTSDYRLLRLLVQHAEQKLAGMQSERGFFSVVRQSVLNMVKPQFPSMEQVAANLNMSPRTLQRRLREEGYTFSSLIDELRRQLACDYLRKKELSIKEIAYLLNYSEPSAFVRSFKRWEQVSPGVWRSRQ